MLRRILIAVLAGLALAGPAQAADWHEFYGGFPPDREPRLCAQRMVERQVAYMQSRGWQVATPELRTWTTGDGAGGSTIPYRGATASALGMTFPWEGRWIMFVSPGTEAGLCFNYRSLTPMTAWRWDDDAMDTGFHEVLHQIWHDGEDQGHAMVVPRAAAMVANFRRSIERAAPKLQSRPVPRFTPRTQDGFTTG